MSDLDQAYAAFIRACGATVADEMQQFKVDYFRSLKDVAVYCPHTGEQLTLGNAEHEYIPPLTLEKMVRQFITKHHVDYVSARYEGGKLADTQLVTAWRRFHWRYAKLRLVARDDCFWQEPNAEQWERRQMVRDDMAALGWRFVGNPKIAL